MLLPSANSFKCHEEVFYLQLMIPPKRFDISPLTGGYSEDLDAFRFFIKKKKTKVRTKYEKTRQIASKTLMMCTCISSTRTVSRQELA